MQDVSFIIIVYLYFCYLSQEKEDEALSVIIRFPLLLVFDSREKEGLLGYHSSSDTLGVQVRRQWRTFEYLAIFFNTLDTQSRESGGRLSYYHTFPFTLGTSRCSLGFAVY